MTWCWVARLDRRPVDAYAVGELSLDGRPAGHLAAWRAGRKPAASAVLSAVPPDAVSTFVRDSSHFAGAVTVRRREVGMLRDDPFARIGHAEVLAVSEGLFAVTAPVPGPVIQRYAGNPWPIAGF